MSARPGDTQTRRARDGDGRHRILILANETIGDAALVREIVRHTEAHETEARIVAPAPVRSPLSLAAGDVDDEIEEARRRIDASVRALQREGVETSGGVGEADPNLALEDAMRMFPADEVVIVAHERERRTWLEKDVVERARRQLDVPIEVIEVEPADGDGDATVKDVRAVAPAGRRVARRERREEREATYGPPMSAREKLALLIGIAGTIALGIASIACADGQGAGHSGVGEDAGTGSCAVPIGLGIGAFIVTVFHAAALLLMRGAGYRGRWEALTAYALIFGIPPAVVLGVIFA